MVVAHQGLLVADQHENGYLNHLGRAQRKASFFCVGFVSELKSTRWNTNSKGTVRETCLRIYKRRMTRTKTRCAVYYKIIFDVATVNYRKVQVYRLEKFVDTKRTKIKHERLKADTRENLPRHGKMYEVCTDE